MFDYSIFVFIFFSNLHIVNIVQYGIFACSNSVYWLCYVCIEYNSSWRVLRPWLLERIFLEQLRSSDPCVAAPPACQTYMTSFYMTSLMSNHIMSWLDTIARVFHLITQIRNPGNHFFLPGDFDLDCQTHPRYHQGQSLYRSIHSAVTVLTKWHINIQTNTKWLHFYNLDHSDVKKDILDPSHSQMCSTTYFRKSVWRFAPERISEQLDLGAKALEQILTYLEQAICSIPPDEHPSCVHWLLPGMCSNRRYLNKIILCYVMYVIFFIIHLVQNIKSTSASRNGQLNSLWHQKIGWYHWVHQRLPSNT